MTLYLSYQNSTLQKSPHSVKFNQGFLFFFGGIKPLVLTEREWSYYGNL